MARIDRRGFLKTAATAGIAPFAARGLRAGRVPSAGKGPVAVSTWKDGLKALAVAAPLLESGASALDAGERGINVVELDPENAAVGLGGLPNEEGVVELDAAVMTGTPHGYGAVGSLREIATASSVARKVMEKTRHCLLVGEGALRFALDHGFERRELLTRESRRAWRRWRARRSRDDFWRATEDDHDTIGYVGIDRGGRVAAIVSTSGLAWKIPGRVGDSPIAGAGLFVDAEVGGACGTGVGEEILRTAGAVTIVEAMRRGASPQEAVDEALRRVLDKSPRARRDPSVQVAYLALDLEGRIGAGALSPETEFHYAYWRGGMERPALATGRPIDRPAAHTEPARGGRAMG